jgi:hypothetical protein
MVVLLFFRQLCADVFFDSPSLLGKSAKQAVQASSSGKAKFSRELVARKQIFFRGLNFAGNAGGHLSVKR